MKTLFAPAIFLLNRLRYPVKFGLVFLTIIIPLTIVGSLLSNSISDKVTLLQKEHHGLEYLKLIRPLIETIPQHRGLTNGYLNGHKSFRSRLLQKRARIDAQINALLQADKKFTTSFETAGRLRRLSLHWQQIKSQSEKWTADKAFKEHNGLLLDLKKLIAQLASKSGLTLNPDLSIYHLVDSLTNKIPATTDMIGRLRGLGAGIIAKGKFDSHSLVHLSLYADHLTTHTNALDDAIKVILGHRPELNAMLHEAIADYKRDITKFESTVKHELLEKTSFTVTGEQLFSQGTRAIASTLTIFDKMLPVLDRILLKKLDQAEQDKYITLLGIVLVSILSIYFLTALYLSIRTSIDLIGNAATRLADGDLTIKLELNTHDELNEIAMHVNRITSGFSNLVRRVVDATATLTSSAEEVSNVARESALNIDRQRSETGMVATAVNEMNATVKEVAANAAHAAEAAGEADKGSKAGKRVVEHATREISQLSQNIDNASTVIERVKQNTESIGTVLDVIKGIAEQTNLLALNAAIEAARAGEQGRGFAVVADEVRTLANRTQQSTEEIEKTIDQLQSEAVHAVDTMQRSREQAKTSAEKAQAAARSLEQIATAVETISQMNVQIASAAEEQSSVADEINKNVTSISEISEQTATGAEQTTHSSAEMARMAAELQSLINRFKIA